MLQASLAMGVVVVALVAGLVLKPYREKEVGVLANRLLVLQVFQLAFALLGYLGLLPETAVNVGLISCLVAAAFALRRLFFTLRDWWRWLCRGCKDDEPAGEEPEEIEIEMGEQPQGIEIEMGGRIGREQRLLSAVRGGDISSVRAAINGGADVDTQNQNGSSPLMLAVHDGNVAMVTELIDAGAGVDLQTLDNATAVMLAAADGKSEILVRLLKAGANTELVNARGSVSYTHLTLPTICSV